MLTHTKCQDIDNNLSVCSMKDSRSWSHMSKKATDGTYLENFCQSFQKQRWEIKKRKKGMVIAKRFALHANSIIRTS